MFVYFSGKYLVTTEDKKTNEISKKQLISSIVSILITVVLIGVSLGTGQISFR